MVGDRVREKRLAAVAGWFRCLYRADARGGTAHAPHWRSPGRERRAAAWSTAWMRPRRIDWLAHPAVSRRASSRPPVSLDTTTG